MLSHFTDQLLDKWDRNKVDPSQYREVENLNNKEPHCEQPWDTWDGTALPVEAAMGYEGQHRATPVIGHQIPKMTQHYHTEWQCKSWYELEQSLWTALGHTGQGKANQVSGSDIPEMT